jgi:hypothetical protein
MAELLQSMDIVVGESLGGQAIEMFRPHIPIPHAVSPHVVDGDQHAMPHRQGSFLRARAPEQPNILRAQLHPPRATRPPNHTPPTGF